ncbi:hypothetical protein NLI96_g502 [Meripilus lineatus]|uniref:Queuosine 5'-phosphate N-glycosylase/hydrolase n=1 Tax=Meripilus lineatus TaxID=2056292 RepID=A0AAD5YNU5_9APHY|nr:hypothetical protein NLI96_g502 [Physisporinus lineatus]
MTIVTSSPLCVAHENHTQKHAPPKLDIDDHGVNPVVKNAEFALKVNIPLLFLARLAYNSIPDCFWSEREGHSDRFGIEWRTGWGEDSRTVHTGYWSLVAAIDRALEEGIPITDPSFYSSEDLCPDALIAHIFRRAAQSSENIPLLKERIAILREVGSILTTQYRGSFQTFLNTLQEEHQGRATALHLVKKVTDTFPSFRDEVSFEGRRGETKSSTASFAADVQYKVCLWKRAQILVAESWAAFHPPTTSNLPHPLFPAGPAIHQLTMFADYRVPQILHHLGILTYPPSLLDLLRNHAPFPSGSREEVSIRSASIVAVERVRREMLELKLAAISDSEGEEDIGEEELEESVSSVMIDFFLWDLAKRVESGDESIEGIQTTEIVPAHRTRSIWY